MARGDVQTAGRRRPKPENKRIAARVAGFCARHAVDVPEGVQPLNAGFFQLEALRRENVAGKKVRKAKRKKVRGK